MKPLHPRPRTQATDTLAVLNRSIASDQTSVPSSAAIPDALRVLARLLGRQAAAEAMASIRSNSDT